MLQNLYVKNLALIDETEVEFGAGLNILTGETGAGKSILMGSVGLALGGKYSADMLRTGAKSGIVELTFLVEEERIIRQLEDLDIYPEDGLLTLTRRLTEGRSVSKINGETVSMGILKDVASMLIDIHGQHDSQRLLHKKNHLAFLDLSAKEETGPLKKEMESCYSEYQKLCRRIEEVSLDEEGRRRELSLAQFEVDEIEKACITAGEDRELEEVYRRMTQSRQVTESIGETYGYTCGDVRQNASDLLSRAIRTFGVAGQFDERGGQLYGQLMEIDSLLNDFNRELSEYEKSFEFSEEEFAETENRLNLLNHLKAKYGNSSEEILAYCEARKERLRELEDYDTMMAELLERKSTLFEKVRLCAERLTEVRVRCAEKFARAVSEQMKELNLSDARLEIRVSDTGRYSSSGKDEAEFYFSANLGEPMKPLGSVASGGELSRVMLAVKTVLAHEEDTPTLIFDEIDTGISGVTAGKVAGRLQLIGQNRQVICITHLPQIAAAADSHFLIKKEKEGNAVHTSIQNLDEDGSVEELARLLGGENITEGIVKSARELKQLAGRER